VSKTKTVARLKSKDLPAS